MFRGPAPLHLTCAYAPTLYRSEEEKAARLKKEEDRIAKEKAEAEKKARLPGEAAAKDSENAKKLKKMASIKEKMRLKAKGFVPNRKLGGFVFPGISPKIIQQALRNK